MPSDEYVYKGAVYYSTQPGLVIPTMTATRNPANVERTLSGSTEFQIYTDDVLDFTERRLERCIALTQDIQQKIMLSALLDDYRSRSVAISWRKGVPTFIRMTKER